MESTRSILIVSLDNIGDTVMGLSLARPLKQAFPSARIAVWTKSYGRDVPPRSPWVDRTFDTDPFWTASPGVPTGTLGEFGRAIRALARERFDLALVLHADWRRALACVLAGIPRRVGCAQRKSSLFLTRSTPGTLPGEHLMDTHARLLASCLGIRARLECQLEPVCPPEPDRVGIHPFAGHPSRRWPFERWPAVFDALRARGTTKIMVIASPAERSAHAALLEEWRARLGDALEVSSKLVEELSRCAFFIGHDSGPLHLAAAFGIPSIGLYLTPKQPVFEPRGRAPCRVLAADRIEEIRVEDVVRALGESAVLVRD